MFKRFMDDRTDEFAVLGFIIFWSKHLKNHTNSQILR